MRRSSSLPSWIAQAAIVLLAIGFPVALIAAWMIESKPHEAVASAVRSKPTIVDWTLCGALARGPALIGYQQIAPVDAQQAGVDAARSAAVIPARRDFDRRAALRQPVGRREPGVLLRRHDRGDHVGARQGAGFARRRRARRPSSSRARTGTCAPSARRCTRTHLIEGSVRKAGDRVRITAQLIKADDGTHIWAENYDRELTDIFAIQEDIARAIAGALRMPLGLQPGENSGRATARIDLDSYQEYLLRAKAVVSGRDDAAEQAHSRQILEQVVARDPGFAPAWATLSRAYVFMQTAERVDIGWHRSKTRAGRQCDYPREGEKAARRRRSELDPKHADGYSALATCAFREANGLTGGRSTSKALALDPNDPEVLIAYGRCFC